MAERFDMSEHPVRASGDLGPAGDKGEDYKAVPVVGGRPEDPSGVGSTPNLDEAILVPVEPAGKGGSASAPR